MFKRYEAKATREEIICSPTFPTLALQDYADKLRSSIDGRERTKLLVQFSDAMDTLNAVDKVAANRVMGCTAQVWVKTELDPEGKLCFKADSDSKITKGLAAILTSGLAGLTPDEVLQLEPGFLDEFGLGLSGATASRANGFRNIFEAIKKQARMLIGDLPRFPSLMITADRLEPQGAFAEAQAKYLQPNPKQVDELLKVVTDKKIGIVAHFYMDPEVQGVLSSAAEEWPHIHVSDSLVMADRAVAMAQAGCRNIAVLGVDFMSENVRAILDQAGHTDVGVYRMSEQEIGCSLADAAESATYKQYLDEAATGGPALHVVYINTSLRTKAFAHASVPTLTCTSSNVVQSILQAFAQIPDLRVFYGPDTYMGGNLAQLFQSLATMPDDQIKALHPAHDQATIKSILPRFHYFKDGICVVHHIFGGEVTDLVKQGYGDAYLTAHFEVPGEMFTLAMEARQRDMGTVGSTSNILSFITNKLQEAIDRNIPDRLQFVLGTESGMITSIVRKVQHMLRDAKSMGIEVEVVFPVSTQSITTDNSLSESSAAVTSIASQLEGVQILPGPAAGEGCSSSGGCASCPYMKMNTLDALQLVCLRLDSAGEALLERYRPQEYTESVGGQPLAVVGCQPILHMRDFQKHGKLSEALVADIVARGTE